MSKYLQWYVTLHRFYRVLVLASVFVGVLTLGAGMATENGVMFVLGLLWLVAGPAVIHLASRVEGEEGYVQQ